MEERWTNYPGSVWRGYLNAHPTEVQKIRPAMSGNLQFTNGDWKLQRTKSLRLTFGKSITFQARWLSLLAGYHWKGRDESTLQPSRGEQSSEDHSLCSVIYSILQTALDPFEAAPATGKREGRCLQNNSFLHRLHNLNNAWLRQTETWYEMIHLYPP